MEERLGIREIKNNFPVSPEHSMDENKEGPAPIPPHPDKNVFIPSSDSLDASVAPVTGNVWRPVSHIDRLLDEREEIIRNFQQQQAPEILNILTPTGTPLINFYACSERQLYARLMDRDIQGCRRILGVEVAKKDCRATMTYPMVLKELLQTAFVRFVTPDQLLEEYAMDAHEIFVDTDPKKAMDETEASFLALASKLELMKNLKESEALEKMAFVLELALHADGTLKEIYYSVFGGMFQECVGPLSEEAAHFLERHPISLLPGQIYFIQPNIERWMEGMYVRLEQGVIVTIDYGGTRDALFKREEMDLGTLFRGYASYPDVHPHFLWLKDLTDGRFDPDTYIHLPTAVRWPKDMTGDVDFTTIEEMAKDIGGFHLLPLMDQNNFFQTILGRAMENSNLSPLEATLAQQAKARSTRVRQGSHYCVSVIEKGMAEVSPEVSLQNETGNPDSTESEIDLPPISHCLQLFGLPVAAIGAGFLSSLAGAVTFVG